MAETLPGTKDLTIPWVGAVRLEWYGAYCSQGHPMPSIRKRTLAITVRSKRFELTGSVRPQNIFKATVLCGECYV